MIRADFDLLADPTADLGESVPAPLRQPFRERRPSKKTPERQAFPPRADPGLGAGRRKGRGGGSAVFRRRPPRFARRLSPRRSARRRRAALSSGAAERRGLRKILRVNADEAALRDLSFAVGDPLGPAAALLSHWRECAGRPPSLDPPRVFDAAARLDLSLPDPNGLAASLKACAGEGDPLSAAAKAAALAFCAFPDAPAPPSEMLSLWVFDVVIAIRLRWPRPVPLIATKILDPGLRSNGGGRPRPGDPAWSNAAAGAIALAAAFALDLAADLSRRSKTLIAVAPSLRAKPASKIVDLLLSQDCISPPKRRARRR